MSKVIRSLSSAFIVVVFAVPVIAQKRTAVTVVAPQDDKVAEANLFMNAKVIAIQRDRDRIEVRDTYGVRRTFALAAGASLPQGRLRSGSEVILSVRQSGGRSEVVAVRASEPGPGQQTVMMNTTPVYIAGGDTSAPTGTVSSSRTSAPATGAITGTVPGGGSGFGSATTSVGGLRAVSASQAQFMSGMVTVPASGSAPVAGPAPMGGGAFIDPRLSTSQAAFVDPRLATQPVVDPRSGTTQASFIGGGGGGTQSFPVPIGGGISGPGTAGIGAGTIVNNANVAGLAPGTLVGSQVQVQPSQTRSFVSPAPGSFTPLLPGQPSSVTRSGVVPGSTGSRTTSGGVIVPESISVTTVAPPTGRGRTVLGRTGGGAGVGGGGIGVGTGGRTSSPVFTNQSLGSSAGRGGTPSNVQTMTFSAPATSTRTAGGTVAASTGTISSMGTFSGGIGTSGVVTAPVGTIPGELPPQFALPGSISVGPSPAQFGTAGSAPTLPRTTNPIVPDEGGLGVDASPLPIGNAVAAFEMSVARLAMRAEEVGFAFRQYRESCVGPMSTIGGGTGASEWAGIWNGSTLPSESREQCEPILAQALRIGQQVQRGMQTAEAQARRSGVLPGIMRQIRAQYGMEWGGWDR